MKDNVIRGMVRAVCPPRSFLTSFFVVLSTLLLLFVGTQLRAADLKVTKDLRLWLKADAGVVRFPNEAGDGGVATWEDRSGFGNNAVQTDASKAPSFANDSVQGHPFATDRCGLILALPSSHPKFDKTSK